MPKTSPTSLESAPNPDQKVGEMTRAELELLIERAAAGVLTEFLHHLTELAATQSRAALPSEAATLQALLEAFEAIRWTPPDGTPSPVEVLRAMRRGESV